MFTDTMLTVGF